MNWFKKTKIDTGTTSGFTVNCNINAVHMRNGKVVKPDTIVVNYIKRLNKWIFKKD